MTHIHDELLQRYEALSARQARCFEKLDKRSSLKTGIPVSKSTWSRYRTDVKRLFDKIDALHDTDPDRSLSETIRLVLMEGATRQSSTSGRRAALINKMGVAAINCLNQAKAALDMLEDAKAADLLEKCDAFITYLELAQQEYRHTTPAPRRSKSASLKGLPPDWPERFLAEARKRSSAYLPRLTALVLTGCRPAEILAGIKVETIGTDAVRFIISCAKIGAGRVRSVTILQDDRYYEAAKELATNHAVIDLGGTTPSRKSRLGDKVKTIGHRAFPRRKEGISPYSFRHVFASDLKAGGYSDTAIAQALGHANIRTKSRYGRYNQGRTGRALILDSEIPVSGVTNHQALTSDDNVKPAPDDDATVPSQDAGDDHDYEP